MTSAERAIVADAAAAEWDRLAELATVPAVRHTCLIKARQASYIAERWRARAAREEVLG
jgi:hypothetical protein